MTERHFDPLDTPFSVNLSGIRLLEAGAGTGKTWTLAALVLRLLLETPLDIGRILVVTYTRAACGELRSRIRLRLNAALQAFESGVTDDAYLHELVERNDSSAARARLRLAIESFDEAAIFTIHGFCQRALGEGALLAGQPFERELIADQSEMISAVARDVWRREMAGASALWAQCLISQLGGPVGLERFAGTHLGRIDAQLAAPAASDRPAAERAWISALAEVARGWQADRQVIIDWLLSARLNQQSYKPERLAPRIATLDAALASDRLLLPLLKDFALFSRATILEKSTRASPAPTHPFFAAVDSLSQAAEQLDVENERAIRRLARDFLETARRELASRKRRGGLQSYDDLLGDLSRALAGPVGPTLVSDLRGRYGVALVDEFQDTDPLQLHIFTTVFGTADHPLIFVGDPKQAIYGFRGADVFAYLKARAGSDSGYALVENRRSDPPLLAAVNRLFARPTPFLLDDLPFEPARPAAAMSRTVCRIDDAAAALTLWPLRQPPGSRSFTQDDAKALAAEATAADIARLLALAAAGRAVLGERPLGGGDFAVLVRRHHEGEAVRAALARRGIPSVGMGGGSVWQSDEAEEVERLLLAVASPSREGLVRAAMLTVLFGAGVQQLAAWRDDDAGWGDRLERFHEDQLLLRERGFMAMWRRLLRREGVVERLLARPEGERRLTNFRHLAELLDAAERAAALDAEGLARHIAHQRSLPADEDNQLRLESDAELVRIVTIHAAKGLQYPVVYCPFLWHGRAFQAQRWPVFAHQGGRAVLDYGSADIDAVRRAADREEAAEELRLAYVALTRAEHRCILAWGKVNGCERSPLAWLLFGPRSGTAGTDDPRALLADWLAARDEAALEGALATLADGLDGALAILPSPADGALPPRAEIGAVGGVPRVFHGQIPAPWRVQSFSALAARLAEEASGVDHDAVVMPPIAGTATVLAGIHAFPRGTRAGSCLHALFERIDFRSGRPLAADVLAEFGFAADWQPVLEQLVREVLAARLTADGLRLADLERSECLVELPFLFPLGTAAARQGYMKGFIDLVFRHAGRWYIVDYKSNWLGASAEDYTPERLAEAMRAHRYDLQMCIYTAALKRALALREPQLDWQAGFGGVFYLFLRGMAANSPAGIYFARPGDDDIADFLS